MFVTCSSNKRIASRLIRSLFSLSLPPSISQSLSPLYLSFFPPLSHSDFFSSSLIFPACSTDSFLSRPSSCILILSHSHTSEALMMKTCENKFIQVHLFSPVTHINSNTHTFHSLFSRFFFSFSLPPSLPTSLFISTLYIYTYVYVSPTCGLYRQQYSTVAE